jgi:hypothetical protein
MPEPEPTPPLASEPDPSPLGPEALSDVALKVAELTDYLTAYLRSQKERTAFGIRRIIKAGILYFLLALFGAAALLTSVAFAFYGAAKGLQTWLGGREWLAYLIVGIFPMLASAVWLKFGLFRKNRSLRREWKAYEEELGEQRARYGHDAVERAAEWASR